MLVTPRTTAQSLYVGMTRGRDANTAHVVCDAHDHDELRLGERTLRDAFVAAMQRDPDGSLSAHSIAERWHAQYPAREAARRADRQLQNAEHTWNTSLRSLPPRLQTTLADNHTEIVRALARLRSNSERVAAIKAAKRVLSRPGATADHFVDALKTPPRRRVGRSEARAVGRSATRSRGPAR